jgi:predicted 3-demethylubiquinone-9 3-methyltransferase (glyoxalase superfamily)
MMRNQKIVPHLWFDTEAEQAVDFYKLKILKINCCASPEGVSCNVTFLIISVSGKTFL